MRRRGERMQFSKLSMMAGVVMLAAGAQAVNLISDGGFEFGDVYSTQFTGTPWTTEYGYATNNSTSGPFSIWNEGYMRVMDLDKAANNATTGHSLWDPAIRTEGHSFLAVNGATSTPVPFVLTQVFDYAGTGPLTVSFDHVNLYHAADPTGSTLEVFMDGVSLGSVVTLASGLWDTASFSTSVASASSHTLKIVGTRTASGGNDFGLDDIQVTPVPEPFTMGLAGLALATAVRRRLRKSA